MLHILVDCRYKRSMFICYVYKLISKFGHSQPKVLLNLFKDSHTIRLLKIKYIFLLLFISRGFIKFVSRWWKLKVGGGALGAGMGH